MEFSTIYELEPGPEPWPPNRERDVYHEALDQLVLTEELGFDQAWAVEHHSLTGYSSSSAPETFLSWAAGKTSRIRLGHGVLQMSKGINHIVRTAERTAALDIISDGRLDVGSGRGFTAQEPVMFEVDPAMTRPMQIHAHNNLPKIWADESFELDDEFYQVPRRRLHPKPVQQPHPPLWMACTQPASWDLAAEMGAGVLGFGAGSPASVRDVIKAYRRDVVKADRPYGAINNKVALSTQVFCAETDQEAYEIAGESMLYFAQTNVGFIQEWAKTDIRDRAFYKQLGDDMFPLGDELTEEEKKGLSAAGQFIKRAAKSNVFLVGSPETCRKIIGAYAQEGVDQMIFACQLGNLKNEDIKNSLRLLAKEVLPEFSPTMQSMGMA